MVNHCLLSAQLTAPLIRCPLLEVLSFNFKDGELLDSLERFERVISQYEREAGKKIDDDIKVGVVIKGIEKFLTIIE